MKPIIIFFFLIFFYFFASSQPNIHKITWVGQNKEHLNISKKTACLQKDRKFIQFDMVKYVKGKYIIFSNTANGLELKTKYNIVHITQDTLILVPEGNDFFELTESDKQNQCVFANSLRTYKFVKLHYEISSNTVQYDYETETDHLKSGSILDIDSSKKIKITTQKEHFNEPQIYRSPLSNKDYERLIKILSSVDLDSFPDENIRQNDNKFRYSILEIRYNDKRKIFKGGIPAFYSKLGDFMWEYMALKEGLDVIKVRSK
jgi:hypothetical protein